jgi:hypothetical protein
LNHRISLESFKQRNALLKCGELFRIEIEFLGASRRVRAISESSTTAAACADENSAIELSIFPQFSKQPLSFRELRENGIVCLGKSVRDSAGQLD